MILCVRSPIEKMAHLWSGSNSVYGINDLNDGMIRAAMLKTSVGGCANSMRAISSPDDTDTDQDVPCDRCTVEDDNGDKRDDTDTDQDVPCDRCTVEDDNGDKRDDTDTDQDVPCDRWFADALARVNVDDTIEHFAKAAALHLKRIARRRKMPKGGLTVSFDAHLISRYDRKPGPELTRSRQKNGTVYFEWYMSVQCVDKGMRLVLAFVPLEALDKMYEAAEKLLDILQKNKISIRLALFDRGFFSGGMLDLLNSRGIVMVKKNAKHDKSKGLDRGSFPRPPCREQNWRKEEKNTCLIYRLKCYTRRINVRKRASPETDFRLPY